MVRALSVAGRVAGAQPALGVAVDFAGLVRDLLVDLAGLFLALLVEVGGGVVVPLDKFPEAAQDVLGLLPIAALSEGLRDVLQHGAGMPWADLGILTAWAVAGLAAAGAFFRWE